MSFITKGFGHPPRVRYVLDILSIVRTDYVQRFLFEDLDIRGRLTCLTGAWRRMLDGRGYPENVAALLGHTTALNVLLGANQGFTWSMTVAMKNDLVGTRQRGLAMGLNEFAGYGGLAFALFSLAKITLGA